MDILYKKMSIFLRVKQYFAEWTYNDENFATNHQQTALLLRKNEKMI